MDLLDTLDEPLDLRCDYKKYVGIRRAPPPIFDKFKKAWKRAASYKNHKFNSLYHLPIVPPSNTQLYYRNLDYKNLSFSPITATANKRPFEVDGQGFKKEIFDDVHEDREANEWKSLKKPRYNYDCNIINTNYFDDDNPFRKTAEDTDDPKTLQNNVQPRDENLNNNNLSSITTNREELKTLEEGAAQNRVSAATARPAPTPFTVDQKTIPPPVQLKGKTCKYCGKFYQSTSAHSMHVRTHEMSCVCTVCGKRFSRTWLLQCHMRTHTGEKPFTCDICHKAFTDKSNFRAHSQTHLGYKPYSCKFCKKGFALRSYLNKHEKSCNIITTTATTTISSNNNSPPSTTETCL